MHDAVMSGIGQLAVLFTWKYARFVFPYLSYTKAQKRKCFYAFSSFSATFYPHYIILVKGLYIRLLNM